MWKIKSMEEAEDLVLGATILGTGGGGDPREGLRLLREVLEQGREITIIGLDELPEDSVIVVPYFVGTIAPTARTRKPVRIAEPIRRAFEEMERLLGRKITAVVASEIGGANTPVALNIAAKLGLPVVDGDLLGRAAPELHQCTVHIFGIPMYPSAIVTSTGNIVIIKEYSDIDDYEALARYISTLDGKFAAVVDTPLTKKDAERAVVKGTISLCMRLGRAVREARRAGRDPVEAVVGALNGWRVFEGVVEKYSWRDEGGFLRGEAVLRGIGRWSGHTLKSWIMNEHIMVWLDDKPLVMPPDLFMLLRDDGEPVTNSELKEGMRLHGIAARAPSVWRTPEGLKYFGPRHFGFDYDYEPVEELVRKAGIA